MLSLFYCISKSYELSRMRFVGRFYNSIIFYYTFLFQVRKRSRPRIPSVRSLKSPDSPSFSRMDTTGSEDESEEEDVGFIKGIDLSNKTLSSSAASMNTSTSIDNTHIGLDIGVGFSGSSSMGKSDIDTGLRKGAPTPPTADPGTIVPIPASTISNEQQIRGEKTPEMFMSSAVMITKDETDHPLVLSSESFIKNSVLDKTTVISSSDDRKVVGKKSSIASTTTILTGTSGPKVMTDAVKSSLISQVRHGNIMSNLSEMLIPTVPQPMPIFSTRPSLSTTTENSSGCKVVKSNKKDDLHK